MKSYWISLKLLTTLTLLTLATSCSRSSGEVWEDSHTASRHVMKGIHSLGGKHGNSRQISSQEEFSRRDLQEEDEFIALEESNLYESFSMSDQSSSRYKDGNQPIPQPKTSPGDPQSPLPGINQFVAPSSSPHLASVFKSIYFPYNSSLVKGSKNLAYIRNIAEYMKKQSQTYIFIEGHCDERGSREYNIALGSRRSNGVRSLLIKSGVDPEQVFTISFGKEKPAIDGIDETTWAKNRRAEFRIYQR